MGTSRALGGWPSGCHRQGLAAMLCFSVYLLATGAWYRLTQQGLAMWLVILPSMLLPAILYIDIIAMLHARRMERGLAEVALALSPWF